jgi:hypothetical protein
MGKIVLNRRNFMLLASGAVLTCMNAIDSRAFGEAGPELVMVEEEGCRFCRKWDTDIGGIYPHSPEGRFAPLRRVKRGAPELAEFSAVVYTPTFILVRERRELGRITGYPGQDYFWEELAPILAGAGFKAADAGKKT